MTVTAQLIDLDPPAMTNPQAWARLNDNLTNYADAINNMALGSAGFTFGKTALTGGGTDALDGEDGAALSGDETALVFVGNNPAAVYLYRLDVDNGGTANSPYAIAPATNAGAKRWILAARVPRIWSGSGSPAAGNDGTTGVQPGDKWLYAGDVWLCTDNSTGAAIWRKSYVLGSTGGTACAGNDSRLSDARTPTAHDNSKHSANYITQTDCDSSINTHKSLATSVHGFDVSGNAPPQSHDHTKHSESYVIGNGAITGATKTKVTYDAKGLVTGGADATASDVGAAPSSHGSSNHSGTIGSWSQIDKTTSNVADLTTRSHTALTDKGTNTHDAIDTHLGAAAPHSGHEVTSAKGAASGYASLNSSSKVVQDPANATATATASKIPIADSGGKLDGWISDAASGTKGLVKLTGQLGGSSTSPTVTGLTETSGPTALTVGAIGDGQLIKRSGTTAVGTDLYDTLLFSVSNSGSVITTGTKPCLYRPVDFAGTIVGWTILGHESSGSIVFDIWKAAFSTSALPTVANTITASAKPTVSSAKNATGSTLTGWTTSFSAGDVLVVNVDSCTTFTAAVLALKVRRTV